MANFAKYLVKRSLITVVTIWVIVTFLFVFFRSLPGSYLDIMLFQGADPATVQAIQESWGLNEPLYVQYWKYIVNFVQLDVGTSLQYRVPVWDHVKMKIFHTFILVGPGITFAYMLGSIFGTILGRYQGKALERYGLIPIIGMGSFPSFFIAIVLIVVFASWLELFPTSGMVDPEVYLEYPDQEWRIYFSGSFAHHYVLPFTAVVARYLNVPTLVMRTSVVETLREDFYQYLSISGVSNRKRNVQLARHSILQVLTLYPISMTRAIGGLVLIEMVFNWPGIGYALVNAIQVRDLPVVQFIFFLTATFIVVANFVIDIVYTLVDPRIDVND
jgi:peptide/nickel transport system permease protein